MLPMLSRATIKRFGQTCWRYATNKLVLSAIAIAIFALVGADPFKDWIIGKRTMSLAWEDFLANLSGFLANPLVRIILLLIALYFFGAGARQVIEADQKRADAIESHRQRAISEAVAQLRKELEPVFKIAKYHVLLERKAQLKSLEEETNEYIRRVKHELERIHEPFSLGEMTQLSGTLYTVASRIERLRAERGVQEPWDPPSFPTLDLGTEEMAYPDQQAPFVLAWDQVFDKIVGEVNAFREYVMKEIQAAEEARPS